MVPAQKLLDIAGGVTAIIILKNIYNVNCIFKTDQISIKQSSSQ